jgi:tRNA nucleotidyltransferase (CCA-adding enzyme)
MDKIDAALKVLRDNLPAAVKHVMSTLEEAGLEVYIVGGVVRDAFLGRVAPDWDLATNALPDTVAKLFPRVVRVGEKHGTIKILASGAEVEVTTYRGEGAYEDGRRPSSVVFHREIEKDLARRDFTVNAMAASPLRDHFVDPFAGVDDIENRVIRCVGEAMTRFGEDGLRPLRAIRFAAVLGFSLDTQTKTALGRQLDVFEKVAWERKRDELMRMLEHGQSLVPAVALLLESGLLAQMGPELCRCDDIAKLETYGLGQPLARLALWLGLNAAKDDDVVALTERWRLSKKDVRRIRAWLKAYAALDADLPAQDHGLRLWLSQVGQAEAHQVADLAMALAPERYGDLKTRIDNVLASAPPLSVRDLAFGAKELKAAGFEGEHLGQVLEKLLAHVLEYPEHNNIAQLKNYLADLST